MTISGKWLACVDWFIAAIPPGLLIILGAYATCIMGSLLFSAVFVWLGIRAWKSEK